MLSRTSLAAALFALSASAPLAWSQEKKPEPTVAEIKGSIMRPGAREATDERVRSLKLPPGFKVAKFAEGLKEPRMMAVGPDGTVYVTARKPGTVTALRDADGDGKAEEKKLVVDKMPGVHGITVHDGKLYLVTVKELFVCEMGKDGAVGKPKRLIDDLPDGGQHPNRTIAFGPDGMLYITVGSTCNACPETSEESATVVRCKADGTGREVFAKGLRNTIGFGWHPETREMWGMDHGIDWLGDEIPPEELNRIEEGKNYGWPYIWGDRKWNPADPPPAGMTPEEYARKTEVPVLTYAAHAAPIAMVFGSRGRGYEGDAFVAMHGSWNRKTPKGYNVVRVAFERGRPARMEEFLTGFLVDEGKACFGRPAGLAIGKDGALLVGDDMNGVIYQVWHGGAGE